MRHEFGLPCNQAGHIDESFVRRTVLLDSHARGAAMPAVNVQLEKHPIHDIYHDLTELDDSHSVRTHTVVDHVEPIVAITWSVVSACGLGTELLTHIARGLLVTPLHVRR